MYNFFTKFPLVTYNSSLAVNVFAKIKFNETIKKLNAVFYPYTIQEGERPDIIAANYYDDARYSWLIYLANDMLDPYYDWPMTSLEFDEFILAKYGSVDNANRQIAYWIDNWQTDPTVLTVSAYNALTPGRKKYFKPIVGVNNQVVNYERNALDLFQETNKTIQITVADSTGFNIGDYITQTTSGNLTGSGFIKNIIDNNIVAQNILGQFVDTSGNASALLTDNNSSNISDVTLLNRSIPEDEEIYWTYVSRYEYEQDLNNEKRFIRLIDKGYVDQIEKEMSELL